jgi:D-alanyl-lipoteichoic acid acyltransferase DltB (MBOAT superfamily)
MVVTLWFFRLKNQKGRILLLLLASCYFYMSFIPQYILILGGTIVIDYIAGLLIEKNEGRTRKAWLVVSLIANIGVLAVFKYYNFFIDNIHAGSLFFGKPLTLPMLKIALPIGLSFHTFQAMSYTIEVYRKNQKAEKHFGTYALYVMFYPQLVAGPIERPQNVLPQLKEFRIYNWDNVKDGIARMLWGFFKKVVIADRLAMAVDRTFSHSHESSSIALFVGVLFYYFQIYCDFSGYSDIALGAAKVMNIKLMENFNQPFFSKNMGDFWRRWHISLYSWFYDYVFNPLIISLRNMGQAAIVLSLLITFFLSGFWHGAAWQHIVYGLIHGVALIFEYFTRKQRKKLFAKMPKAVSNFIGIFITFFFVVFTRIFFRAENMQAAIDYFKGIFSFSGGSNYIGMNRTEIVFSVFLILLMLYREKVLPQYFISSNKRFYFYTIAMVVICYFLGVFSENQFIYFQF